MHALIGTASSNQASALRDALYRHVARQTFIGVSFAVRNLTSKVDDLDNDRENTDILRI